MLKVSNLFFRYNKKSPKNILDSLNLNLKKGNIYCLLGKNGVGKTTLLHSILDLNKPLGGDITVNQNNNTSYKGREDIFFVPDNPSEIDLSIKNYSKALSIFYKDFNFKLLNKILSEFELKLDQKFNSISFGQRKKAFIAIAVASNCGILFFDEPTNGLDIISKKKLRQVLTNATNSNKLIILSTHQIREVEAVLSHILVLDKGNIIFDESISKISEKLYFSTENINYNEGNILYSENMALKKNIISENTNDIYSKPDLELLYQGLMENSNNINNLF